MTVSDILKLIGSLSTREQNMLRTLLLNDATKVIKIEQLISLKHDIQMGLVVLIVAVLRAYLVMVTEKMVLSDICVQIAGSHQ
jgi:hypothetical protein